MTNSRAGSKKDTSNSAEISRYRWVSETTRFQKMKQRLMPPRYSQLARRVNESQPRSQDTDQPQWRRIHHQKLPARHNPKRFRSEFKSSPGTDRSAILPSHFMTNLFKTFRPNRRGYSLTVAAIVCSSERKQTRFPKDVPMKSIMLLALWLLIFAVGSVANPKNSAIRTVPDARRSCNCIEVKRIRGQNCGRSNSLRIEYSNSCSHSVSARIYIKQSSESAFEAVGGGTLLGPGEKSSYFWCKEPYWVDVACD